MKKENNGLIILIIELLLVALWINKKYYYNDEDISHALGNGLSFLSFHLLVVYNIILILVFRNRFRELIQFLEWKIILIINFLVIFRFLIGWMVFSIDESFSIIDL